MRDEVANQVRIRQAAELAAIWLKNPGSYYRAIRRCALEDGARNCVYFARCGSSSAVKVGYTHHGPQRMGTLRNSSPVPILLEAFINFRTHDEAFEAEGRAHELAADLGKHIKGEWFELNEYQIAKVVKRTVKGNIEVVTGALWKEDR